MKTARLNGRPVTSEDLRFISDVWNDARVTPTIGEPCTEDETKARIERWTRHWADHGFGTMVFEEQATVRPIGWGGLQYSTIGIGERLTVGYVIAPDAWRRGFASEIAGASVNHAFDVLGVGEVYASVLATNGASRRVLEKAGLAVHQEIDHAGHVEVVYVIAKNSRRRR
jgi:RimJ/RimL family protein N-acetyltransferase